MPATLAITSFARRALDIVLLALVLIVLSTLVVARVVPAASGASTFVVGGGSMEPAIPLGSVVIAAPVPASELAVGDVVSLRAGADHAVFTHRVTRLVERDGGIWLQTKGDANGQPDPSLVPASDVIGRVALTLPALGYVMVLLGTLQGVAFLIALGILVLAATWLLETLEDDQRIALRRRAQAGLATLSADPPAGQGVAG
jgi:signal peptidase